MLDTVCYCWLSKSCTGNTYAGANNLAAEIPDKYAAGNTLSPPAACGPLQEGADILEGLPK